mgnify:CR=1 FL=1
MENYNMEKMWKTFFHMWKTVLWKNCEKLSICGKRIWKSGKYVENYVKGKNAQKNMLFLCKR